MLNWEPADTVADTQQTQTTKSRKEGIKEAETAKTKDKEKEKCTLSIGN